MSMPPLVSIVIRSMGRACLKEALWSVQRQSHRPLELVVVDATGGAHPPLPELPGIDHVRLVGTGQPLNRPAAANAGLTRANGTWIGFVDDDDFLEPTHVARLVGRAQEADRPTLVYAQLWGLDRFHRVTQQRHHAFNPLIMYYYSQIMAMSCLMHRSLIETGFRLDETLATSEDWDLWLKLIPHAQFATVREPTHFYFAEAGTSGTGIGRNRHEHSEHGHFHRIVKERYAPPRDEAWRTYFERLETGIALQKSGRVEEARVHYENLLAEFPDEPNALYLIAQTFVSARRFETARALLRQAIYHNGDAANYHFALGEVCAVLGYADESIAAYRMAARFDPSLKTMVAQRLSATLAAQEIARPGSDAIPGSRNAPCPCASGLRFKACCGRFAATPHNADRASPPAGDALPLDMAQRLDLALADHCAGNVKSARNQYEAIAAADPGNAEALHALALIAWDCGEPATARA